MLSLSAEISESSVDLGMINGDESATVGDVEHAQALMKFAQAIALRDDEALVTSREQLRQEAGDEVMVDAAAVAANFQRMVRIADSTGIPVDDRNAALSVGVRKELDLGRFASAANSPSDTLKTRLLSLIARPMAKRMLGRKR
jgi:hypothetical protein